MALFLLVSCTAKRAEMPSYEGVELKDMLAEMRNISSVKSTFSIEFEKTGNSINGDAVLSILPDAMDLQVYSHGFLVAEVTSRGAFTGSIPPLEKKKLSMLIDGIRGSFLWWQIKDYDVRDENGAYLVANSWRKVLINKKTLLPEKQTLELEDGKQVNIFYEEPEWIDGTWFPAKMHIELSNQSVNINIKTLSVNGR